MIFSVDIITNMLTPKFGKWITKICLLSSIAQTYNIHYLNHNLTIHILNIYQFNNPGRYSGSFFYFCLKYINILNSMILKSLNIHDPNVIIF